MPRFPEIADAASATRGAVYSTVAARLAAHSGERYPLHIGDTWMEPPAGCRMEDLHVAEYPGMHRYAPVAGLPTLLEAIAARVSARSGQATAVDELLITSGATGALAAAVTAIAGPGDEVLILAPYWPLIEGIVHQRLAIPVPVPAFAGEVADAEALIAALEARLSPRSVAVYLNTPNNPTGRVLPRAWVEAVAAWARSRGLWILADEVYEDYIYAGEHVYTRPLAPERTLAAHSFSKAYGMAGNRCGYLIGPAEVIVHARKAAAHTFYSTPTAAQIAAERVLAGPGDAWVRDARARYQALGEAAAARLGVPAPAGSTFLFLDVAEHLDERGLGGLLERCADRGLLIAPGPSFGPYPTHVRLCFTSAPPEVVERGVEILAAILGR
ncbi:MAG: pyridoxal phosphate-dependent aminotransferase [Myxococcales bacterium]|nr:pyridoxal phosphate-dependent aminotransferase [Myxococcales bacterium]MCB9568072.1 pyridoxal phosphate-dependent aminotransferase [Myxococcales bacterium]MCB9705298.1 pyridoxal phosphate-dependent aminotransferase [Myxococcales bacterium]